MGSIKGVHHICLRPNSDLYRETVLFYTEILGCETVRRWGEGESEGCMVDCGDGTVMEIVHGSDDGTVNTGALHHIAFCADDVASLLENVRSSGWNRGI